MCQFVPYKRGFIKGWYWALLLKMIKKLYFLVLHLYPTLSSASAFQSVPWAASFLASLLGFRYGPHLWSLNFWLCPLRLILSQRHDFPSEDPHWGSENTCYYIARVPQQPRAMGGSMLSILHMDSWSCPLSSLPGGAGGSIQTPRCHTPLRSFKTQHWPSCAVQFSTFAVISLTDVHNSVCLCSYVLFPLSGGSDVKKACYIIQFLLNSPCLFCGKDDYNWQHYHNNQISEVSASTGPLDILHVSVSLTSLERRRLSLPWYPTDSLK